MPCHDPRLTTESMNANGLMTLHPLEAVLCGILTKTDASGQTADMLSVIDWQEAGVPRDLVEHWWKRHKMMDKLR